MSQEFFMRFHLVSGAVIDSAVNTDDAALAEAAEAREAMTDILRVAGGDDDGQLNVELENGGWAVMALRQVAAVSLIVRDST